MREKQYILFDLDGTLTDPAEGITTAFQFALSYFGIEVQDKRELYRVIGPPLIDSFMQFYGFDEKEAELAVHKYREYFSEKGIFENQVYPGIPELLKKLKEAGKTLMIATSKPTVFAKRILVHFDLDTYFDYVSGSGLDGSHAQKAEVIAICLKEMKVTSYEQAVMIGDRSYDIEGANEVGVDAIGVLYGYGSKEELSKAGAHWIAEDINELKKLLLEK